MQLKNVVLPAPLGPISETIPFSGTVKSTSLTAVRPPKRFVIPRASRSAISAPHRVEVFVARRAAFHLVGVQLHPAPAVRDKALRPQDHHRQQEEAEDP